MARNGSGTYVLPAGQPVVTGTTISSTVHNTLASDLANALTTSMATDGQSVVTANIPLAGYKLTGLAAATVAGDAIRFEQALGTAGLTLAGPLNEVQGADIASAATVNLTTATGDYVNVTGTTAITAITLAQGYQRTVKFAGILTLTNGASLILPGGANITTAAGDTAVFIGEAAGVVRCVAYQRASGAALAASAIADGSITTAKIADANVTPAKLSQPFTAGTAQNSTSGTTIDFTGIPSWVKRITVLFNGVSLSGSDLFIIQLGTVSGFETTTYKSETILSGGTAQAATNGLIVGVNGGGGANTHHGSYALHLVSGNIWVGSGVMAVLDGNAGVLQAAGSKTLAGTLTQVRITPTGSNTFDAGSINILYE